MPTEWHNVQNDDVNYAFNEKQHLLITWVYRDQGSAITLTIWEVQVQFQAHRTSLSIGIATVITIAFVLVDNTAIY